VKIMEKPVKNEDANITLLINEGQQHKG